jgi:hypothetical protein
MSKELEFRHESEDQYINRLLAENAEYVIMLDEMTEASRRLNDAFRMTLQAHNLKTDGHQKAFSAYNKAKAHYESFMKKVYSFQI